MQDNSTSFKCFFKVINLIIKSKILYATGTNTNKESNINVKNKNVMNAEDYLDNLTGNSQNNLSKDVNHDNNTKNINLTFLGTGT